MKNTSLPKIVLTPRNFEKDDRYSLYNYHEYGDAIKQVNGIPVQCEIITSKEEAKQIAKDNDGLLITGGLDVNPSIYHQDNTHSDPIPEDIELTDIYLIDAFNELHKPILGICRGIQIINAHFGGTLIQDIPTQCDTKVIHNQGNSKQMRYVTSHLVTTVSNTLLANILGQEIAVNSFHHQCVDQVAPGFLVNAYSEDGIIEGIEKDNILAIQWHPERLLTTKNIELFKYLIKKASN